MAFFKKIFRQITRKRSILEDAPVYGRRAIARLKMISFPPNQITAWSFVVGRTSVDNILKNIEATKKKY
ncbi:MAG: hypothetical protein QXL15_03755, partial [Candidatus Korarchaeota archaeon]